MRSYLSYRAEHSFVLTSLVQEEDEDSEDDEEISVRKPVTAGKKK